MTPVLCHRWEETFPDAHQKTGAAVWALPLPPLPAISMFLALPFPRVVVPVPVSVPALVLCPARSGVPHNTDSPLP